MIKIKYFKLKSLFLAQFIEKVEKLLQLIFMFNLHFMGKDSQNKHVKHSCKKIILFLLF